MQENATLVTGVQPDGVVPVEGDGMLALYQTGGFGSQVRQRIDVSALATDIDLGLVTASAVGKANASIAGTTGGCQVTAYDIAQTSIGVVAGHIALDGDTSTWEATSASLLLPTGTRYVEHEFQFPNSSLPPGETGYGDEAGLVLEILFDGLPHTPLGNAQLSVDDSTGFLIVSNIGSTGVDGVAIDLGEAFSWSGLFLPHGIAPFDGSPLPPEATMRWDIFGNRDGEAPGELLTTGWWDVTAPNEMSWHASTPGATGYQIEVYDTTGTLLFAGIADGDADNVKLSLNSCDRRTTFSKTFFGDPSIGDGIVFEFDGSVAGPLIVDGTPVPTTDEVVFEVHIAALSTAEVSAITRIEITGANLPLFDNDGTPIMALRNEVLNGIFADGFESGDTTSW
jgi:hypothetical protein